jgi:autotransporter translocation and assembly factor TamB
MLVWDESQAIALTGSCQDDQSRELTLPLGKRGELTVARPELRFQIAGSLDAPVGTLELTAGSISWQREITNTVLPKLESLQVSAEIRPEQIKLNTFTAALESQGIEASGVWPVSQGAWRELWLKKKLPDWERAQGNLNLREARLAALSRYLPSALAPEGWVSARLELKPGKELEGILLLTNAATRALGKLAPLREINARVRFDQQRATLEDFHGQIGGQAVSADGFVTIPGERPLDYRVNLRGTNVPLARSLELLLRGDFDVQLRGGSNAPPVLTGTVRLHDGLFVQHAAARVWQGPRRPQLRPPYFSVTNAPLADWRLDLTLAGEQMLRVQTPEFKGLVSANLNLRGSLRQPVLTGDVRADAGRVV